MQVEAFTRTGTTMQQPPKAAESVDAGRKKLEDSQSSGIESSAPEKNGVQPEEVLNQIKSLTDNGVYSVRFENSKEFDELVVKIVDTETDEVIRQVPAEEVLGMKMSLEELRGSLVNTVR